MTSYGSAQRLKIVTEDGREVSLMELLNKEALPSPPQAEDCGIWSEMLRNYKNNGGCEIMGGIHYRFSVTDENGKSYR